MTLRKRLKIKPRSSLFFLPRGKSDNVLPMLGAGGGGCNRYIMMITAASVSMLFIVFNLHHISSPTQQNNRLNAEPKVHFRTYGDDNYNWTKARIVQEAPDTGWFVSIKALGPDDLTADFKRKFEDILKLPRGGGLLDMEV